jgi:hypothetical protein
MRGSAVQIRSPAPANSLEIKGFPPKPTPSGKSPEMHRNARNCAFLLKFLALVWRWKTSASPLRSGKSRHHHPPPPPERPRSAPRERLHLRPSPPQSPAFGNAALAHSSAIRQNSGMNPDSHEEIPVTLDEVTKAKLDEAVAATGLTVAEVLRLAIESGLRVMETDRQN